MRLLNPPGPNPWNREIVLKDPPATPEVALDPVEAHVEVGLHMRPDLNQARLEADRDELELVRTRNGLLPKLDLFITLGKTGYARSFGESVRDLDEDSYEAAAGLVFTYPLGARADRARHARARLTHEQALEAVENLAQIVELDVRSAYIEVNRAKEQITASRATLALQEEKHRIETEKLRVGRSTVFLVSQARRDLLSSRIAEVQAVVNYLKALVTLFRLEGSLLERRGVAGDVGN